MLYEKHEEVFIHSINMWVAFRYDDDFILAWNLKEPEMIRSREIRKTIECLFIHRVVELADRSILTLRRWVQRYPLLWREEGIAW